MIRTLKKIASTTTETLIRTNSTEKYIKHVRGEALVSGFVSSLKHQSLNALAIFQLLIPLNDEILTHMHDRLVIICARGIFSRGKDSPMPSGNFVGSAWLSLRLYYIPTGIIPKLGGDKTEILFFFPLLFSVFLSRILQACARSTIPIESHNHESWYFSRLFIRIVRNSRIVPRVSPWWYRFA